MVPPIVGILGTGGVGKTTISTLLSIAFCYSSHDEGLIVAVDADVTEALLTKILLGPHDGPDFVDLLVGRASLDQVLLEPNLPIAASDLRGTLPSLRRLRIVPGAHSKSTAVRSIDAKTLASSLRSVRESLSTAGASLAIVDFPPGDPQIAEYTAALSMWIDGAIAVVSPSRRRIASTAYACKVLSEQGVHLLGVILNKFTLEQPFDEYGNRWEEVVKRYFRTEPIVITKDPDLESAMTQDAVPIEKLASFKAVRDLSKYSARLFEEIKRIEISEGASWDSHNAEHFVDLSSLDSTLKSLFCSDAISQQPAPASPSMREQSSPSSHGMGRGESSSKNFLSKFVARLSGRDFQVRYPSGKVAWVRRSMLKSALEMAGMHQSLIDRYLQSGQVDLSQIPPADLSAWRFALLVSGLDSIEEGRA